MICLTLMENSLDANLEILRKYRSFIDMVELRLDMLVDPLLISPEIVKCKFDIPVIITYRRKKDGGKYEGSEKYRRTVLHTFVKTGFNFIDLEMGTAFSEIEDSALKNGTRIIRSYHNFEGIPDNIEGIIRNLASRPGEIPKLAVYPGNSTETLKFFKVFEKIQDINDKIILAMGVYGIPSRILYKKLGSMLSFCSCQGNSGAPGQLSPEEMKNLYRADSINNSTEVFGIIGNPVMHSRSPQLHNTAYQRAAINAVYIPFLVDNISNFFELAVDLKLFGFSVTVPHKINVLKYLTEKSREINSIMSCNTVIRKGEIWKGFNTDPEGFLRPLLSRIDVADFNNCAVIGAGGAARAVISALKSIGKEVSIFNRSKEKAEKLANETKSNFYPLTDQNILSNFDLIVQTTTVGMSPFENETPLPGYEFREGQFVYDIIYTPLKTKFLIEAEASGADILGGMEMLITQGIRQFELFTNQPFPSEEQKGNS
jgi:3-dehydroquinate dehydratase / shikimate dehydrogenase